MSRARKTAGTVAGDEEETYEHESYGMVAFNRIHGLAGRLFGSSLRDHHSSVRLVLKRGMRRHHLSRDWYSGVSGPPLVEVILSAAQFADLLTTMNVGDGVPCTIRFAEGRLMEDPPDEDLETEKVRASFKKEAREFSSKLRGTVDEIRESFEKKNVTKADRKEILEKLASCLMEVEENLPFILESFEESAEKVVGHAKAEIDAFATHTVMAAGLEALADGKFPKALPGHEPSED